MRWSAIVIGSVLTFGLSVMLILFALQKGHESSAPRLAQDPTESRSARADAALPSAPTASNDPAPAGAAAPVPAAAPAPESGKLLHQSKVLLGTLRTVDASGPLGYLPLDADVTAPSMVTTKGLLVNPATQITLDGKPAEVAALRPGMDIAFLDSGDKPLDMLDAFTILPDGNVHTKRGTIDKIAPNQVVLLAGRKDLFPVTLTFAGDVPTTIDGKPAAAADLRYRMSVVATCLGSEVRSIAASTVIMDGAQHHADGNLVGAASADELTIRVYGKPGFDVKLKPDANFKIQRETSRGTPATVEDAAMGDLQPGMHVVATYANGIASDVTIKFAGAAGGRGGRGAAATTRAVPAGDPNRP